MSGTERIEVVKGAGSAPLPYLLLALAALPASAQDRSVALAEGGGGSGLELVTVASGFSNIVNISHAGDERLFLAEQAGQILILEEGATSTFLDLSGLMGSGFEGGIKSVAFHPTYPDPGFFFVHYSDVTGDSVVARYSVSLGDPDVADPGSAALLITVDQSTDLHRGGQLQFGPDGFLYIGLGDGGPQTDTECHAQRPDTFQGKLLRVDVDQNVNTPPHYGIPPDNPFSGSPDEPFEEVWALGLRQPWRFSFDRLTGDLYIGDVGQNTQEEVDFQPAGSPGGANYGWRVMEGMTCHDPDPVDQDCPAATPSCFDPSYTDPVLWYDIGGGNCSVTGGYVYRGSQIQSLYGRYLYGDWCSGNIWAARDDGGWTSELLPVQLPGMTTFGEDRDGNIYLSNGSTVSRLDDPSAVFSDGFESGDTSSWSTSVGELSERSSQTPGARRVGAQRATRVNPEGVVYQSPG